MPNLWRGHMKIQNSYKPDEAMISNISLVLLNIGTGITNIFSTLWGKLLTLLIFVSSYFASISGILHIIVIITIVDAIFGVAVAIKVYGRSSVLSSKLRLTLYKLFFYLLFIIFTFLIEGLLVEDVCITSKLVFAIMAGVELWSIAANGLILYPNFPFLRLFSKYLSSEIGKKLNLSIVEVEEILKYQQNKKTKDDTLTVNK